MCFPRCSAHRAGRQGAEVGVDHQQAVAKVASAALSLKLVTRNDRKMHHRMIEVDEKGRAERRRCPNERLALSDIKIDVAAHLHG